MVFVKEMRLGSPSYDPRDETPWVLLSYEGWGWGVSFSRHICFSLVPGRNYWYFLTIFFPQLNLANLIVIARTPAAPFGLST